MKKITLICLFSLFVLVEAFSQSEYKHSILISPGSLVIGRANLRYEKINESHFTYGGRLEASLFTNPEFGKHIWVIPYGRYYPFSKELNGLYGEFGVGYRLAYAKGYTEDENLGIRTKNDNYNSAPVIRFYLGGQWFVGKKSKIPFDIGLGLNIDTQLANVPEGEDIGNALVGPLSALSIRIQTGIAF